MEECVRIRCCFAVVLVLFCCYVGVLLLLCYHFVLIGLLFGSIFSFVVYVLTCSISGFFGSGLICLVVIQ